MHNQAFPPSASINLPSVATASPTHSTCFPRNATRLVCLVPKALQESPIELTPGIVVRQGCDFIAAEGQAADRNRQVALKFLFLSHVLPVSIKRRRPIEQS